MGRRRAVRYRISDLLLLVGFMAFVIELPTAVASARFGTAMVCLASIALILGVLALQPGIGAVRCPYCGRWGIRPVEGTALYRCDDCATRCERVGPRLRIVSCPADDRPWVIEFLPKLRTIRRELRPGFRGVFALFKERDRDL
jgi:hypothetical protein